MSNVDIGPRKTMFILVIVVGCFAVLWPKVFYPMLVGHTNQQIKPDAMDKSAGCCDVIWENDINAIRIINDLCSTIIHQQSENDPKTRLALETGKLTKEIIATCRLEVLSKCNVDIATFLSDNIKLGKTYRQLLDELRSTNSSLCLKYNFGVAPWSIGVRHPVTINVFESIRQERPPHIRPEIIHPALREKGRAIPPSHMTPHAARRIMEGKPGPVPGMRPTIGGAGHVVPPKTPTSTMGVIMPIYTIGIVIFFTYTLMKILFKKQDSNLIYPTIQPDPVFRKQVFNSNFGHPASEKTRLANTLSKNDVSNKLVVTALSDMLAEVDQRREALARKRDEALRMEHSKDSEETRENVANGKLIQDNQNVHVNGSVKQKTAASFNEPLDERTTIKVLGMEVTESCEGGKKWSRPSSPIVAPLKLSSPSTPPPPQAIILDRVVPAQSQLLVSESATNESFLDDNDDDNSLNEPAIMLSGKMTLSVIPRDIVAAHDAAQQNVQDATKSVEEKRTFEVDIKNEEIKQEKDEDFNEDIDIDESRYTTVSAATEAVAGDSEEEEVVEEEDDVQEEIEEDNENGVVESAESNKQENEAQSKNIDLNMVNGEPEEEEEVEEEVEEEEEIEEEIEEKEAD